MLEEDLYNEMILPTFKENLEAEEKVKEKERKKYSLYIGNFTWWTTDQELQDLVTGAGVTDLVNIQIHDNPLNGLSKGYATVTVESAVSIRLIMTKLQDKIVHNRKIYVDEFVLANMQKYENAFDELLVKKNNNSSGQQLLTGDPILPITTFSLNLSLPPPSIPNNIVPQIIGIPPVYFPVNSSELQIHTVVPNSAPQLVYPPNNVGNSNLMAQMPDCIPVNQISLKSMPPFITKKMLTKEEFEEVFSLNRAVVEQSMERASQDAEAGLYTEAIETLVTAISLIKESRLGSDPQGVALMRPLQELLHEIENESLNSPKGCRDFTRERSFSPYYRKKSRSYKRDKSVSPYERRRLSRCDRHKSPNWNRGRKRSHGHNRERFHSHEEKTYKKH